MTEEALKRSEEKFAKIFMNSPVGMGLLDLETLKVIDVNSVFQNLYGYTREEAVGKTTVELNLYENIANRDKIISMIKNGEMIRDFELKTRQRNGSIRTVSLDVEIITIDGRLSLLVVAQDITERKRIEEALKNSEENLKRAQAIAHLGSWEIDLIKNELMWSDEAYRIFSLQPQEFGTTIEAFLDIVHPEDRDAVSEAYNNSIQEDKDGYEIEHRIILKSGEVRFVHEKCLHLRNKDGKIMRSSGMVHDITERKLQEQKLEKSLIELKRSNKELEQFAYITSHDLQEPIRMIKNFTQLIELKNKDKFNEDSALYFKFITEGASRMQYLIDDLLKYSRISTAEKLVEDVDCNKLVENVLADLKLRISEESAIIQVDKLPIVKGNRIQLHQLFQNFIQNALKFRSERTPEIKIASELRNRFWLFSIIDNGIGINSKHFDRIFVIFQRLHDKDTYPGTGIGLALCKKIVEQHGGQVCLESVEGKGTVFYFTLPV